MKNDLVDLDALERILKNEKSGDYFINTEKIFWGMFYTIPTYHNPTGMTLSPGNKKKTSP